MRDSGNDFAGRTQKARAALLMVSHLVTDTYGGFIAVLLPYFISRWDLSLTEAGGLATAFFAVTNFGQPFFGWLTDRKGRRWLLAGGPLVSALFIGSMGALPTFELMFPWVIMGGVGAAAFHPPAASLARRAGGKRGSLVVSIFLMCGFLGMALGPLELLAVIATFGLHNSYISVIPGVVISILLFKFGSIREERTVRENQSQSWIKSMVGILPSISMLWLIVVLRTVTTNSFLGFIPILMKTRDLSDWMGGMALSGYMIGGGIGGILGGYLGDRFDRRRLLWSTMVIGSIFLSLFLVTRGWLSMVFMVMGGITIMVSGPLNLVMAQEMHPKQSGLVSSLMIGGAFGTGSLVMVVVGAIGDEIGIQLTLSMVVVSSVIAAWFSYRLPLQKKSRSDSLLVAEQLAPEKGN